MGCSDSKVIESSDMSVNDTTTEVSIYVLQVHVDEYEIDNYREHSMLFVYNYMLMCRPISK